MREPLALIEQWKLDRNGRLYGWPSIISGLLLASSSALASPVVDCGQNLLSVDAARAAIAFIGSQVRDAHVRSALDGTDAAEQRLGRLAKTVSARMTSADLARRINAALSVDHDGHLRLELSPASEGRCLTLPVSLNWTDDGLLVLPGGALPAGARIESVGGRSLDELEMLAAESIPHENLYWARSTFARLLPREDVLRAFGLADRNGGVEVVYETTPGVRAHERLVTSKRKPPSRSWVGFEIHADDSMGVFWLARCDPNDEFFSTLAEFMRQVRERELHKVVVDLRGNPGGDASVALAVLGSLGLKVDLGFSVEVRVSEQLLHVMPMFAPSAVAPAFQGAGLAAPAVNAHAYTIPGPMVLALLAQRLGDHALEVVPDRTLYLLTDGGTFSSAALFAALVRDNHLGTLVGEPTGNSVTFNGSEIEMPVPGLDYVLHLSTARLVRPDISAGPAPTLLPDLRAPQSAAALRRGQDAAIELIRVHQR
jgi:hypothetical protein